MSKGHSSTEKMKKNPPKPPKSESSQHAIPTGQRPAAFTVPEQLETAFPHISEPQPTSI